MLIKKSMVKPTRKPRLSTPMAWRRNLAATKHRNSRRKKLNAVLMHSYYSKRPKMARD
jgi:hypothetical protein